MAESRIQTSSKSIQRARLPRIRQRDAGSKVEATSLTGCGIPRFKQSIMTAMTESDSHSVPNKHSKSDKATGDLHSESICWILLYTIRQWTPSERKSACAEHDSYSNGQHPGSCRTIPASPESRQVQDNCTTHIQDAMLALHTGSAGQLPSRRSLFVGVADDNPPR
jgi:hypothetical protein